MQRGPNRRRAWLALTGALTTLASLLLVGVQAPPAHAGHYRMGPIKNRFNQCLTAPYGTDWVGQQVTLEPCAGALPLKRFLAQQWEWRDDELVINRANPDGAPGCLDTSYARTTPGTPIVLGPCRWTELTSTQRWSEGFGVPDDAKPSAFILLRHNLQLAIGSSGEETIGGGQVLERFTQANDQRMQFVEVISRSY